MEDPREAIGEFWRFFQKHKVELAGLLSADHPVYDLILEKLQRINPRLYFEFSSNSGIAQLIITAEGEGIWLKSIDIVK